MLYHCECNYKKTILIPQLLKVLVSRVCVSQNVSSRFSLNCISEVIGYDNYDHTNYVYMDSSIDLTLIKIM